LRSSAGFSLGGSTVKRRFAWLFCLGTILALFPAGAAGQLRQPGAFAQDRILPLKIKVGDKAPDFALLAGDGKTVKLSDFKGHAVLLDFYRGFW
jgi:cytochrome oxidase Cu insertion factor (SCO1/SenC/PrrC family)